MRIPPMEGVPAFARCRAGVSSRSVSPPFCSSRRRWISQGPMTSESTRAEMNAIADRNVRYRNTLKMMWSRPSGARRR